jgi:hypothetical protein
MSSAKKRKKTSSHSSSSSSKENVEKKDQDKSVDCHMDLQSLFSSLLKGKSIAQLRAVRDAFDNVYVGAFRTVQDTFIGKPFKKLFHDLSWNVAEKKGPRKLDGSKWSQKELNTVITYGPVRICVNTWDELYATKDNRERHHFLEIKDGEKKTFGDLIKGMQDYYNSPIPIHIINNNPELKGKFTPMWKSRGRYSWIEPLTLRWDDQLSAFFFAWGS